MSTIQLSLALACFPNNEREEYVSTGGVQIETLLYQILLYFYLATMSQESVG